MSCKLWDACDAVGAGEACGAGHILRERADLCPARPRGFVKVLAMPWLQIWLHHFTGCVTQSGFIQVCFLAAEQDWRQGRGWGWGAQCGSLVSFPSFPSHMFLFQAPEAQNPGGITSSTPTACPHKGTPFSLRGSPIPVHPLRAPGR